MTVSATCLLLFATAAAAEAAKSEGTAEPGLTPGSRLRVFEAAAGGRTVEGTLSAVEKDRLTLNLDEVIEPVLVDLRQVSRIEVRTRESSRRKGAAIGAGAGVLGLLAVVAATNGCGDGTAESELAQGVTGISDGACWGFAGLAGGAAGALIGVAVSHGERWETLPTGAPRGAMAGTGLRWRLALRPRALGVSVSLGF